MQIKVLNKENFTNKIEIWEVRKIKDKHIEVERIIVVFLHQELWSVRGEEAKVGSFVKHDSDY